MSFEKSILNSNDFTSYYQTYKENIKIQDLLDFLDNIDTNKKYYRMNIQKNKKYKQIVTNDTQKIKTLNSLVNKITDMTYDSLKEQIISLINVDYIVPYFIENIIENSIVHQIYIPLYVGLVKELDHPSKYSIIKRLCMKYHSKFFIEETDSETTSTYQKLCSKNKNIDNIIGYSLLVAHLEKNELITNYVDIVLEPFMNNIFEESPEDIHKIIISFSNISEILYDTIPEKYLTILHKLKTESTSKIKFLVMDILDE